MSQYFPSYRFHGDDIKVELDLSSFTRKADLKNVTHVDVSSFASKTNLANLKTEVDKIYVDKLRTIPVDLAMINNAVKHDVVKKTKYNSLKTKVDSIEKDGSDFEDNISKIDKKYLMLVVW